MECCDMKGYLSYLTLWILSKERLNGAGIASELEKRRGSKPSPGTIYPVIKELKSKGLIVPTKDRKYALTKRGEAEMKAACGFFCKTFYDMKEMFDCCKKTR